MGSLHNIKESVQQGERNVQDMLNTLDKKVLDVQSTVLDARDEVHDVRLSMEKVSDAVGKVMGNVAKKEAVASNILDIAHNEVVCARRECRKSIQAAAITHQLAAASLKTLSVCIDAINQLESNNPSPSDIRVNSTTATHSLLTVQLSELRKQLNQWDIKQKELCTTVSGVDVVFEIAGYLKPDFNDNDVMEHD